MSGPRARIESWLGRGLAGGALLGAIEAVERGYAVREFLRTPAEFAAFAALAFAFCVGTGVVVGLLAALVAMILDSGARLPISRGIARAVLGAALGLGAAGWLLFALTLTVRFDRVVSQSAVVFAAAALAGSFAGLLWPRLTAGWRFARARRDLSAAVAGSMVAGIVVLHLWNAHFAPQSSLGIHVLADTALAIAALTFVSLVPVVARGRGLIAGLAAVVLLLVWTDRTMRSEPVLENLIKTRGAVSAHAIRMWTALLDLDRDGHGPALLVGGEDPDDRDPRVPAGLRPATAAAGGDSPALRTAESPGAEVAPAGAPHLVLLTLDACRVDVMPPYTPKESRLGEWLPPRPRLEAIANRAARFLAGYTPSAGTEDTFAAMFSGWDLPGILAGVPRERYFPVRLGAAGYEVRGFVNDSRFAVSSFESGRLVRYAGRDGRRMMSDAAQFLDSLPPGRPGFVWIHVMDLHADLLRPFARETFSHRAHLVHYARALARVDSMVGDFAAALDKRALTSRTFLVMTADHGEELGGHGHYHHNLSLYQAAIRVPLWIMGPGVVAGDRPARISLQALYPTLLEAGGVEPGESAGRSLWPVLRGNEPALNDSFIYSFLPHRGFSQIYGTRFNRPELGQATLLDAFRRHKVILRLGLGSWEAYDVAADSMERWNLAGRGATWPDSLKRLLEHMIRERSVAPSGLHTPRADRGSRRPRIRSVPGRRRRERGGSEAAARHSQASRPGSGAEPLHVIRPIAADWGVLQGSRNLERCAAPNLRW